MIQPFSACIETERGFWQSAKTVQNSPESKGKLFEPLRIPVFRALWIATIFSNVGTLMQGVGAAWLMTSLTPSTLLVGLVQTSATLPVFLVGLLAGALADVVDRRLLLLCTQGWMLLCAAALSLVTYLEMTTPVVLLGLTFCLGLGAALNLPTWQAIMQDIVPRKSIASAVSLNSMSFNVARSIGPAIGGFIVTQSGPAAVFLLNAVSFVAVLVVLYRWKPLPREPDDLDEDVLGAIRAGIRYILHAPHVQAVIARAAAFLICGCSIWSLMPLLARDVLKTDATGYGLMLGAFGLGSIVAAISIPSVRKAVALDWIIGVATVIMSIAYFVLSRASSPTMAWIAILFAGLAWIGVLINFNVAVQTSVPAWVRGRAISFYLLIFQGMLALGGALWGGLAGQLGIQPCFAVAGAGLLIGLLLIRWFPLSLDKELDLRPSAVPDWVEETHSRIQTDPEEGPVLITIEYFVKPENETEFRATMRKMREIRLRDGARRWRLYHDLQNPGRFLELYRVDSWAEHMRQHERFTMADVEHRVGAFAMHTGGKNPQVTHYLAVEQ